MKILWKGKEYPEVEDIPGGVIAKIEREIRCDIDEWSKMTGVLAAIFAPVYLTDPVKITWAEVEALTVDQINECFMEEPGDKGKAPADRKAPTAKAAARRPRKSAPRKQPATARAAADS